MPPPIVTRMVVGREAADCAIVTLAMYLDRTYEDVLRAASDVDRKYKAKHGLYESEIRRIAKNMGVTLRKRKRVDLEEDYGILLMPDHVAILRNGLLIDTNGTIWNAEEYLSNERTRDAYFDFSGILFQE